MSAPGFTGNFKPGSSGSSSYSYTGNKPLSQQYSLLDQKPKTFGDVDDRTHKSQVDSVKAAAAAPKATSLSDVIHVDKN
ncbi:hypothetical protein QVD17_28810 [Tagetes erecta]|uniref:Uncharacterized protein n=1 Tax=Tagetes erecta TaxID=13708 RepID=A0AAD8KDH7_TARER|nr:hypothetical protein QVD17_28810 [Tagetes erecta]